MSPNRLDSPPETLSPRAFAHYRQLVELVNREPVVVERDYDLTEAEMTWDRLTACEADVFGIDPRLLNALVYAHLRYENMIGTMDTEFMEFRDEERTAYPQWFKGECIYSLDDAIAFMALACRLPVPQAIAWVSRAKVQQLRSGLIDDAMEPPDWAFAGVSGQMK